jgi:Phage integrase family
LLTAIFTGLRASELRGLRWVNVDLTKRELHVRERADEYKQMGRPKSAAGERTVPLSPIVVSELRKWKLKCPKTELGLAFPSPKEGVGIMTLKYIVKQGFWTTQAAAGSVRKLPTPQGNSLNAPNIQVCILFGTFLPAGVLTGKSTVAWNCLLKSFKSVSDIPRSQ